MFPSCFTITDFNDMAVEAYVLRDSRKSVISKRLKVRSSASCMTRRKRHTTFGVSLETFTPGVSFVAGCGLVSQHYKSQVFVFCHFVLIGL